MDKRKVRDHKALMREDQVARIFNVSVSRVRNWIHFGGLKGVFAERCWWIDQMDLIRFTKERRPKQLEEQDRRRAEEIEEIRQRALADAPKIDF